MRLENLPAKRVTAIGEYWIFEIIDTLYAMDDEINMMRRLKVHKS
jgi:hypothetical protein